MLKDVYRVVIIWTAVTHHLTSHLHITTSSSSSPYLCSLIFTSYIINTCTYLIYYPANQPCFIYLERGEYDITKVSYRSVNKEELPSHHSCLLFLPLYKDSVHTVCYTDSCLPAVLMSKRVQGPQWWDK